MFERKIITPPKSRTLLYHMAGLAVLCMNKMRYAVRGYRDARPFSPEEIDRAVAYDQKVVGNWLEAFREYAGQTIEGRTVLELGPGADLGCALCLLAAGASQYATIDANRLINQTPATFYDRLLETLRRPDLRAELENTLGGQKSRITYLVDPSFSLSKLEQGSVDVVVSQAAFEHFADVEKTLAELSPIVKPGGVLIAEIDLMTHTGVLRARDPLNIYRYSDAVYRALRYVGIPNRLRPNEYRTLLERHGWHDVRLTPLQQLPPAYTQSIERELAPRFRSPDAQMHVLTLLVEATKA